MAKLVNCKTCHKELSSSASACPHCGQKQGPSLFVQFITVIFAFFITISLLSACFGNKKATSDLHNKQDTVQKEEPVYIVNVEGLGKIKGIIRSNVGIAVAGIEKSKTVGDNPYMHAKAQGEFIIVKIIITNNQKDEITIDANSFKIIDDKNREFSHSLEGNSALSVSSNSRENFFLKKINPGNTIFGYVVFDVPTDITGAKLQASGGFTGEKGMLPLEVQKTE